MQVQVQEQASLLPIPPTPVNFVKPLLQPRRPMSVSASASSASCTRSRHRRTSQARGPGPRTSLTLLCLLSSDNRLPSAASSRFPFPVSRLPPSSSGFDKRQTTNARLTHLNNTTRAVSILRYCDTTLPTDPTLLLACLPDACRMSAYRPASLPSAYSDRVLGYRGQRFDWPPLPSTAIL